MIERAFLHLKDWHRSQHDTTNWFGIFAHRRRATEAVTRFGKRARRERGSAGQQRHPPARGSSDQRPRIPSLTEGVKGNLTDPADISLQYLRTRRRQMRFRYRMPGEHKCSSAVVTRMPPVRERPSSTTSVRLGQYAYSDEYHTGECAGEQ